MKVKIPTDRKDELSSNEISHSTNVDRPGDLDQAYYYLQHAAAHENTNIDLRSLRRKIDWRIVPIMFCAYTMQFIDKVLLNVRSEEVDQSGMQTAADRSM